MTKVDQILSSKWKWGVLLLFHFTYVWIYESKILTDAERAIMTKAEILEHINGWKDFKYICQSLFYWFFAFFLLHDGPRFEFHGRKMINLLIEFFYAFALSYFTWDLWDQAFNHGERIYQGPALIVSGSLFLFLLLKVVWQSVANYTLFTSCRILLARLKKLFK